MPENVENKPKLKKKKVSFKRQEGYRHAKLKDSWRKPKGKHSKQRMHEKGRGRMPNPGYGAPLELKGLNKDGFEEVVVNNIKELEALNPKKQAALVGSTVGAKKKEALLARASELKIRVANAKLN